MCVYVCVCIYACVLLSVCVHSFVHTCIALFVCIKLTRGVCTIVLGWICQCRHQMQLACTGQPQAITLVGTLKTLMLEDSHKGKCHHITVSIFYNLFQNLIVILNFYIMYHTIFNFCIWCVFLNMYWYYHNYLTCL